MHSALIQHLFQLRIDAEVKVVELDATDVSAYTYERTLIMEQRNQLIRNLKAHKRQGNYTSILGPGLCSFRKIFIYSTFYLLTLFRTH